jgi:hypothetical protein
LLDEIVGLEHGQRVGRLRHQALDRGAGHFDPLHRLVGGLRLHGGRDQAQTQQTAGADGADGACQYCFNHHSVVLPILLSMTTGVIAIFGRHMPIGKT